MSRMIASRADGAFGRLMLGFVDTCSLHPLLTIAFFGLLLALVALLWIEMLGLAPKPHPRRSGPDDRGARSA